MGFQCTSLYQYCDYNDDTSYLNDDDNDDNDDDDDDDYNDNNNEDDNDDVYTFQEKVPKQLQRHLLEVPLVVTFLV